MILCIVCHQPSTQPIQPPPPPAHTQDDLATAVLFVALQTCSSMSAFGLGQGAKAMAFGIMDAIVFSSGCIVADAPQQCCCCCCQCLVKQCCKVYQAAARLDVAHSNAATRAVNMGLASAAAATAAVAKMHILSGRLLWFLLPSCWQQQQQSEAAAAAAVRALSAATVPYPLSCSVPWQCR